MFGALGESGNQYRIDRQSNTQCHVLRRTANAPRETPSGPLSTVRAQPYWQTVEKISLSLQLVDGRVRACSSVLLLFSVAPRHRRSITELRSDYKGSTPIVMADKVASPVVTAAPAVSSPAAQASPSKKAAAAKSKKPRSKPAHPRTSEMVNAAIKSLKERGGSSLQAIKKYVSSTYKLDAEKLAPFIKKYLKTAVASGALVQTKGKGASGSFKLSAGKSESATPKPKSQRAAAPRAVTGPKKAIAKKPGRKPAAASKKAVVAVAEKRKVLAKGPAAKPPKAKTPSKAKRASKAPTRKPKAPKPKKVAAVPTKSSPRKAIAPKRK